jgi:glutaredoxin-related protein
MIAKKIYEYLDLVPKSQEDIRKDLNFTRDIGKYERYIHNLDNKLIDPRDKNGSYYEVVLVLQNNGEWWLHFYKWAKWSHAQQKWNVDQMLSLDQVRSIVQMRAANKKFDTFPNSRNSDLIGINALMMEVGKTIQEYHKLKDYERNLGKKKITEGIADVLKSKDKEDVYQIFRDQGIYGDNISIRVRTPGADYVWLRLERCLSATDTVASDYHGPVPEEENESDFIKVSGKPWNVLKFNKLYHDNPDMPAYLEIETLKMRLIKESLNEGVMEDITLEYIKPKIKQHIFDISSDMLVTAYKIEQNKEEEDDDEVIESEDFNLWLDYEIEILLEKAKERIDAHIDWDGNIDLWRIMMVDDNWFEHLKTQGNRIGEFWSFEEHAAEPHWGYNIDKHNKAVIKSSVNEKHINWERTLILNSDPSSEEEKEISLFKNTPLKIEYLEINGEEVDITPIKDKIFKA